MFDRVIVIVLDGCGAGAAPDAKAFNDFGENEGHTLANVWKHAGGINAPTLIELGYFAAAGIDAPAGKAAYGRLREVGIGKDTVTGHWEMMGIHVAEAFPTYPNGFPISLVKQFEHRIGLQTIGNEAASGTEIIERLGPTHVETGCPILYTSADSVFQLACHEEVIPIERQYEICMAARAMLVPPNGVGRVIARPFVGSVASGFTRTERRRDYPLVPPPNLIDRIAETTGPVFGIGVLPEVFAGRGFREVRRTQDNAEHYEMMAVALASDAKFIWANFEDFDMLYGHRNDPDGFARALEVFDGYLSDIRSKLSTRDLLIVTADHGNDPTTPSTDHSREYVPVSIWYSGVEGTVELGDNDGLWCIGATIASAFGLEFERGRSLIGGT
ncbi:MAG: phosphopentomutase [Armatimonadota bacterium]|nr:phosphopentomutase [Armatimonadota bacterium]